ncbi:hypothetical protein TBLA_0E02100 [Henningerozyma blattae CBS 6284]|uniref:histidine kinase n=1 Tax=Henningerozyma blattae (strain ATCC 34711 / CBS 6284 / DSM 70876 / NBRC 10599 / NRRL Y-10934 / UCD 77-7) TaxID=1071380 RepID=I2H4G1_HENB6|nr:hypothetical protein TBLA_0E02100 [Tetrapisispora blattae CBS 6284]CCH61263.1 hypothetical protein TBLA_0E02100 [Tetrapisispora blattae CBS 6284]
MRLPSWKIKLKMNKQTVKPPYRFSLRAQLTILVCIVAIISLTTLAIITGVYFTTHYKDLNVNRLYIASQLKSSQIDQTLNYLYYQCYWVASRNTIQTMVFSNHTGMHNASGIIESQSVLDKFVGTSDLFYYTMIYDKNLKSIMNSTNNESGSNVEPSILSRLLPLSSTNTTIPPLINNTGILTDPILNSTKYLMSMSLPISGPYSTATKIGNQSNIYGYLTVVMSAESLKSVFNDTAGLSDSTTALLSAIYTNDTLPRYFHFVFPPFDLDDSIIDERQTIKNGTFQYRAFDKNKSGSKKKVKLVNKKNYAIGYAPTNFPLCKWVAVVALPDHQFYSESRKLTKIICGTVVGIAVFVFLISLPLSYWAVQPIVRLQRASELITKRRGLRNLNDDSFDDSNDDHTYDSNDDHTYESKLISSTPTLKNSDSNIHDEKSGRTRGDANSGTLNSNNTITNNTNNKDFNRLRRNVSVSTHVSLSEFDEIQVPVYRKLFDDELTELTDTFNVMSNALDEHYALLEKRVHQRTKQLEAAKVQAEAANEAKTVFIANISHELRTPLNGILGMTSTSLEENDIKKIKDGLKLIFRSGELLLNILTELLTFSKNVLNKTKLEYREFNIIEITSQIKTIFNKLIQLQEVKLFIRLLPKKFLKSLLFYGDSNRILQVLMNLISNAIKFTPTVNGKVEVNMYLLGEYDEEESKTENYSKVCIKPSTQIVTESGELIKSKIRCKITKSTTNMNTATTNNSARIESNTNQYLSPYSHTNTRTHTHPGADSRRNSNVSTVNNSSISLDSESSKMYDNLMFNRLIKREGDGDINDIKALEQIEGNKKWVIRFEVIDNGPGIDQNLHDSVFKPFVQGDQTLSRQYGGTGLGLSICKQLCEMMKGTLELESELGKGSKFIYTIPLLQVGGTKKDNDDNEEDHNDNTNSSVDIDIIEDTPVSITSSSQTHSDLNSLQSNSTNEVGLDDSFSEAENDSTVASLDKSVLQKTRMDAQKVEANEIDDIDHCNKGIPSKLKVLVAEDNLVNQEVIKRMLKLENISDIELAFDGIEAFEKVKKNLLSYKKYDIIFMDIQMPKMDGLESTTKIRQELKYEGKIVALTAFADESNIKECRDAGMDGFIEKPIKRVALHTLLEEFQQDL